MPNSAESEETERWVAPEESPLTVVAENLRVRYKVVRTERTPRKGLAGKLRGKRKVSVGALRGISLTARSGEFIGIIGRNGSGKSTLLRVLAGLEPPSSGTVMTSAAPMLLGVNAALIPDLTGAQNITLGALAMGLSPQQAEEVFDDVVELSALGDAIDLPMRTYSSGMGSRLKFAISLAADPSILMIDEALSTGDATFAERSKKATDSMLERAGTVFLVNHAAQTIETMCSRAIWMERGQVVLDGDAVEVARKYRWFAHNLAQGEEEKAAGLLRDAIEEGAEQRRSEQLFPASGEDPGPAPAGTRPETLDFEPDPFSRVFDRSRHPPRKTFPPNVHPDQTA
ncbi:polysaccharide ABC transporter ATP-binding protein [Brachybacterium avium]|uniref:Polysaccharide ABC transporter ATP-binding protein n=1 Tax=Brachybacterium avium TaxID=2017485 RepID=A0A220UC92_9MICO|nr:ABC transporter ATP-binding protein [Brachybacterium avium]ASK65536.1 polysaccharide ABC transporter ATP-binding protein [Brachybacterium avium]